MVILDGSPSCASTSCVSCTAADSRLASMSSSSALKGSACQKMSPRATASLKSCSGTGSPTYPVHVLGSMHACMHAELMSLAPYMHACMPS
jgi:hypothetical protein